MLHIVGEHDSRPDTRVSVCVWRMERKKKAKRKNRSSSRTSCADKRENSSSGPAVVFPSSTASLMSPPIVNALFQVLYCTLYGTNKTPDNSAIYDDYTTTKCSLTKTTTHRFLSNFLLFLLGFAFFHDQFFLRTNRIFWLWSTFRVMSRPIEI